MSEKLVEGICDFGESVTHFKTRQAKRGAALEGQQIADLSFEVIDNGVAFIKNRFVVFDLLLIRHRLNVCTLKQLIRGWFNHRQVLLWCW